MVLAFTPGRMGETRRDEEEGTESPVADHATESPAGATEQLMEQVCERENCLRAIKQVRGNGGGPGIDGMTVHQLRAYLIEHWVSIREQLLMGNYTPRPVKRV